MKNTKVLWRAIGVVAVIAFAGFSMMSCGGNSDPGHRCSRDGHVWGEWETTTAPTETEYGEETRNCQHCAAAETRPLPPLGGGGPDCANCEDTGCEECAPPVYLTVEFNTGGGTDIGSEQVRYGQPLIVPTDPAKAGYTFEGWYTSDTFDFATAITVNKTLYARWITRFVRVDGGTFPMGRCPRTGGDIVTPVREVTVSGFYISRYQVTQGEWYDVMETWPSFFDGTNRSGIGELVGGVFDRRDLPVEQVSRYDAIVFANLLSLARGLTPAYELSNVWPNPTSWSTNPADWGDVPTSSTPRWNNVRMVPGSTGYRLPTEAQWEFAARGGNQSRGYEFSGGNTVSEVAWYSGNSGSRTHPVGTRVANELGLYDMSGNVWEWVWDWWGWGTYPSVAETDPVGASSGSFRILRGGCWVTATAGSLRPVGASAMVSALFAPRGGRSG